MDAGWVTVEDLIQSGPFSFTPIQDPGGRAYRFWWEGGTSPEYFLIENRVRRGYDALLPGEGLLVYHVEDDVINGRRSTNSINEGPVPGLRVEEADGRYDMVLGLTRGDEGDPFPGSTSATRFADDTRPSTRSYFGSYTNIALSSIEKSGDPVRAWVQIDAAGWGPPVSTVVPARLRLPNTRPVARQGQQLQLLGLDDSDSSRVYALHRSYGLAWSPLERVSSLAGAVDAAWADPLVGPLTAVWTDRRFGVPGVSYRRWLPQPGPERRATFSPGFANHPGAFWRDDGRLGLLWLDTRDGKSQIYFKTFSEGQEEAAAETRVSDPFVTKEVLDFAVARATGGSAAVVYAGRDPGVDEIYLQTYVPDSGWTVPSRLSQYDGYPSGSPDVVALPNGNLRVLWRDSSPTRTTAQTVQYDPRTGLFVPEVPTLFSSPFSLATLRLGPVRPDNSAMVIARATEPPNDRVLVGEQHSDLAWDYGMGWISRGLDAGSATVALDLDPDGLETALWSTPGASSTTIWTRQRAPAIVTPVAVPPPASTAGGRLAVTALPNPARLAARFRIGAAPEASALVLYSLAGRRVARLPAGAGQVDWRGVDDRGRRAAPGIYLYRVEDGRGLPLSATGKLVWLP
jgi:hypothetical protein